MSVSEEMRLDKIRKIKRQMRHIQYPQPFCSKLYSDTNCMAYAVGIKVPDYARDLYFPGGISGRVHILNEQDLIDGFISDMKQLGIEAKIISPKKARERTVAGIQVIALYFSKYENDIHFFRKDKEGGWSQKAGYVYAPEKVKQFDYETRILTSIGIYDLVAFFSLRFQ